MLWSAKSNHRQNNLVYSTVCLLLTLSQPIPLKLYALPYWSNPTFLICDIWALRRSGLSARAPECQKIKNGWLDQYGAKPFEQQQFGTAGVEGVNKEFKWTLVTAMLHMLQRTWPWNNLEQLASKRLMSQASDGTTVHSTAARNWY